MSDLVRGGLGSIERDDEGRPICAGCGQTEIYCDCEKLTHGRLPWEECGYEQIPERCEVCGDGKPVAICIGVETLAYCQGCIGEAERLWTAEGETGDIRRVFR